MDVRFSQAAGAYQDALRAAQRILQETSLGNESSTVAKSSGGGFMDMVSDSLQNMTAKGYASEQTGMRALSGKADLSDVILAVNGAETALNTVVAVRDKVINAYQDIIKMPI